MAGAKEAPNPPAGAVCCCCGCCGCGWPKLPNPPPNPLWAGAEPKVGAAVEPKVGAAADPNAGVDPKAGALACPNAGVEAWPNAGALACPKPGVDPNAGAPVPAAGAPNGLLYIKLESSLTSGKSCTFSCSDLDYQIHRTKIQLDICG